VIHQQPLIALEDVSLTYQGPPRTTALQPCNLQIKAGDYVTITGHSGSGKSSLLNLLGLLDVPTTGRYKYAGTDVAALPERKRAAMRATEIGFVYQSFHLLDHRPVWENVAMAMLYQGVHRGERRARATEALETVGMGRFAQGMPHRLSGGERQRVALARAIAGSCTVLLCDEPTGNLDTERTNEVLDLLDALNARGLTVVVITHEHDVAQRGRRHVSIRDGVVRETTP
jgi:putative ABC transport system ATP-binding protein